MMYDTGREGIGNPGVHRLANIGLNCFDNGDMFMELSS